MIGSILLYENRRPQPIEYRHQLIRSTNLSQLTTEHKALAVITLAVATPKSNNNNNRNGIINTNTMHGGVEYGVYGSCCIFQSVYCWRSKATISVYLIPFNSPIPDLCVRILVVFVVGVFLFLHDKSLGQ